MRAYTEQDKALDNQGFSLFIIFVYFKIRNLDYGSGGLTETTPTGRHPLYWYKRETTLQAG